MSDPRGERAAMSRASCTTSDGRSVRVATLRATSTTSDTYSVRANLRTAVGISDGRPVGIDPLSALKSVGMLKAAELLALLVEVHVLNVCISRSLNGSTWNWNCLPSDSSTRLCACSSRDKAVSIVKTGATATDLWCGRGDGRADCQSGKDDCEVHGCSSVKFELCVYSVDSAGEMLWCSVPHGRLYTTQQDP